LAASKKQPGVLWTHNDSGDAPVVYAMTRKGRSLGMWTVEGAEAFDWEDMALGPGEETGLAYLYVGDIGDNIGTRTRVAIYRFPEPRVDDVSRTVTAEKLEITYPDGPHNAEALMVDPFDGTIYILTKSSGSAVVYRTEWVDSGAATLQRVTRLKVPGSFGGVTGADISPAGDRVVMSTYTGAVELVLAPGKNFDSIWHSRPRMVDVGVRAQGEAIAYSAVGSSILATSEGIGSPIILVRLKP
jgi:hypothetical protein